MAPGALAIVEETIPTADEALGSRRWRLVVHVYATPSYDGASYGPGRQERARADLEAGAVATAGAGRSASTALASWIGTRRQSGSSSLTRASTPSRTGSRPGRGGNIALWLREGTVRYVEYGVAGDYGWVEHPAGAGPPRSGWRVAREPAGVR